MKLLLGTTCAALLIACGGGAKQTAEPLPKKMSACAAAADHVATVLVSGEQIPADKREPVVRVITERCEADRWADDVVACITTADMETFEGCAKQLTEAQHQAVLEQLEREAPMRHPEPASAPGGGGDGGPSYGSPPPPPPDDPCGGGA